MDDKLVSIIGEGGLQELERLIEALTKADGLIVQFNDHAKKGELKIQGAEKLSEFNAGVDESLKGLAKLEGVTKAQAEVVLKLAKAQELESKTRINNQRLREKEVKTLEREGKITRELSNDYLILSKAYNDAALKAKNYAVVLGQANPVTVEAQANANKLRDALVKADFAVGQFGRNVGNYNGVGTQFNQLLREVPNAGISLQTFIISLSNNITYFGEAVKLARSQGQSWGEILGVIRRQLFGFVGIMTITVALVTAFSKEIAAAFKNTDLLAESVKKANEAWASEAVELQTLNNEVVNANTTQRRLLEIRDDLVRQYPKLKDNLAGEENLQFKLANAINLVSEALKEQAVIRAAQELISEETKKLLNNELTAVEQLTAGVKTALRSLYMPTIAAQAASFGEVGRDSAKKSQDNIDRLLKVIADAQAKLRDSGEQDIFGISPAAVKSEKEKTDELQKQLNLRLQINNDASPDLINTDNLTERQKQIELLQLEEAQRIRALTAAYAENAIGYEEYQQRRQQIAETTTRQLLLLQAEEIREQLRASNLTTQDKVKLEKQLNATLAQLRKEDTQDVKNNEAEKQKKYQETLDAIRNVIDIFATLGSIIKANSQAEIDTLNKRIANEERLSEKRVRQIEREVKDEQERNQLIREEEAKTESQRLAAQQRIAAEKRRQAQLDKAIAITNILFNTAVNVAKNLGNPFLAATIAALGAAQLAAVASQPIPEYAKGTENHKGGLFVAGDGGEHELIAPPNKAPYWSAAQPTLYNEAKGTRVIPKSKLEADMAYLGGGVSLQPKQNISVTAQLNEKEIVRAIRDSRPIVRVNVPDNRLYYRLKGRK